MVWLRKRVSVRRDVLGRLMGNLWDELLGGSRVSDGGDLQWVIGGGVFEERDLFQAIGEGGE